MLELEQIVEVVNNLIKDEANIEQRSNVSFQVNFLLSEIIDI